MRRSGVAFAVASVLSVQLGASLSVLILPSVGAFGVLAIRFLVSAVLLLAFARPRLGRLTRSDWLVVVPYGLSLTALNVCFTEAIARIPQGVTLSFEILGPLTLAVVTGRSVRAAVCGLGALVGVGLVGLRLPPDLDLSGVVYALAAGGCWAAYIIAARHAAKRLQRLDGIAVALTIGAVVTLPLGIVSAGTRLLDWRVLAVGAAVAVLASAIPYAFDALALRRITATTFAVLTALAPAAAVLTAFFVLGQRVDWIQMVGLVMVVVASAYAVRIASPTQRDPVDIDGGR